MLKELIKGKQRHYAKKGDFPTAVKMSEVAVKELSMEAKSLNLKADKGYTGRKINGCYIFTDTSQKEPFIFGYLYQDKFYRDPF